MKPKFNPGDKIKCIDAAFGLVNGQIYTVESCEADHRPLVTVEEFHQAMNVSRFELVTFTDSMVDQVRIAESFIGKKVIGKDGKVFKVEAIRLVNKLDIPSWADSGLIDNRGWAVYLEDDDNFIEVSEAKESTNAVQLTEQYTAIVEDGVVKVGCQTITFDKVRELLGVINNQ